MQTRDERTHAGEEKQAPQSGLRRLAESLPQVLSTLETVLYIAIGVLLAAAAVVAVAQAAGTMWRGVLAGEATHYALTVLDKLLLVLMLVEVLHTIRISIRSRELMLVQPFLVVGLIASIRRVLVITMQAADWAGEAAGAAPAATAFRNAMIELGVLGALVLIFVVCIYLLHRSPRREDLSG